MQNTFQTKSATSTVRRAHDEGSWYPLESWHGRAVALLGASVSDRQAWN